MQKELIQNSKFKIKKLRVLCARDGQSLAEVMVGLAIGAILIGAASFAITTTLKTNLSSQRSQFAASSAQEIIERVRGYASADWQNIYGLTKGSSTPYFFVASSSQFLVVQGSEGVVESDVRNGLVGQWGLDEATGTVAYDGTGNKNNGTLMGGPTRATSTCKIGNCLGFNGSTDYVSVSSISQPNERTYTWWHNVSVNGSSVFPSPIAHGGYSNGMRVIWRDDTSDKTTVQVTTGSDVTPTFTLSSLDADQVGIWYHYVLTYDGINTGKLYKNGVLVDTKTSGTGAIKTTASPFYIGVSQFYWNGLVDDVRFYNRVLSADEAKQLYNNTAYTRYFYVENGCRTNDASSTFSGVSPCGGGSVDDPSSQKVSSVVQWGTGAGTGQVTLADILTRWKNAIFQQSDWSGGISGGVLINSGTTFASSTNINSGGGTLRINGL